MPAGPLPTTNSRGMGISSLSNQLNGLKIRQYEFSERKGMSRTSPIGTQPRGPENLKLCDRGMLSRFAWRVGKGKQTVYPLLTRIPLKMVQHKTLVTKHLGQLVTCWMLFFFSHECRDFSHVSTLVQPFLFFFWALYLDVLKVALGILRPRVGGTWYLAGGHEIGQQPKLHTLIFQGEIPDKWSYI